MCPKRRLFGPIQSGPISKQTNWPVRRSEETKQNPADTPNRTPSFLPRRSSSRVPLPLSVACLPAIRRPCCRTRWPRCRQPRWAGAGICGLQKQSFGSHVLTELEKGLGDQHQPQRLAPLPKAPYTADFRTPAPNTIPGIVFGTEVLKWAVYGPFGPLSAPIAISCCPALSGLSTGLLAWALIGS